MERSYLTLQAGAHASDVGHGARIAGAENKEISTQVSNERTHWRTAARGSHEHSRLPSEAATCPSGQVTQVSLPALGWCEPRGLNTRGQQ